MQILRPLVVGFDVSLDPAWMSPSVLMLEPHAHPLGLQLL